MARVIPKSSGKDVLDIIKWKDFVVIYANCLFFTFFIICKNVLLSLKRYIGNHFAPTRQHIAHKFPALSLISRGDRKVSKHQHSIGCPRQLMDPQLGTSKYMKLKVRIVGSECGSSDVESTLRRDVISSPITYRFAFKLSVSPVLRFIIYDVIGLAFIISHKQIRHRTHEAGK